MKKAMFFSIDAVLGAMIIIGGIIAASGYHVSTQTTTNLNYVSQDLVNALGTIRVNEVKSDYVSSLISSGKITQLNNTLLEQIGEFWSYGDKETAINLTKEFLLGFSGNYGYGLFLDGQGIWSNNVSGSRTLVSSFKMISGIAENKTSKGYIARASALGLSGNSTDVFVFNPEGSGYGAGASKKAIITKRVYLNYSDIQSANLYLAIHTGNSAFPSQNKFRVNGVDVTGSFVWSYTGTGYVSNTNIYFGNTSVKSHLINGWNNVTLELFGQNTLHTHLHPGGRLEVTYLKNKEYVPYENVVKRIYLDEIKGWGGAWAVIPIEIPQDVIVKEVTFSLRATNIDNKPAGQIPVTNKFNAQIYLDGQTIALFNPDAYGVAAGVFNLTSKVHEGTNVLSVYLNCFGDTNWGDSNEKTIESKPQFSIGYLLKENYMESILRSLGATVYQKSSSSETNAFLSDLSKYLLVVIEDPHLKSNQMSQVEAYVQAGGIVFISEHALDTDTGTIFGRSYEKNGGSGSATVQVADPFLGLSISQILNFAEKPTVSGAQTGIATYSNGKAAIANWSYGSGRVYYFSDFDESVMGGSFRAKVSGAIQTFVPVMNSSYIEIRYDDMNRRRLEWGKLAITKAERIGGASAVNKMFQKNITKDYSFLDSYIGLATLDNNNTRIWLNGNQEFYTPMPFATPTNIFMDPGHFILGNNTFILNESCTACKILPETLFYYTILVPAAVGYGGTFPTLAEAKADAKSRLISLLGEYVTYTTINENNSMIISNVPAMWGPAIVELRVWH